MQKKSELIAFCKGLYIFKTALQTTTALPLIKQGKIWGGGKIAAFRSIPQQCLNEQLRYFIP